MARVLSQRILAAVVVVVVDKLTTDSIRRYLTYYRMPTTIVVVVLTFDDWQLIPLSVDVDDDLHDRMQMKQHCRELVIVECESYRQRQRRSIAEWTMH